MESEKNVPLAPVERAPEEEFVFTAEEEEAFNQWRGRNDPSEELIWHAAEEEKDRFVKYLVSQGYGAESLLKAAKKRKETIVRSLVEAGVDIDTLDNEGRTPLIVASIKGHADVVDFLAEAGANIDHKDSEGSGRTALIHAVNDQKTAIVEILVKHGADPFISGCKEASSNLYYYDYRPLEWVVYRGMYSSKRIYSIISEYEQTWLSSGKRAASNEQGVTGETEAQTEEAERLEQQTNDRWEVIGEAGYELVVHRNGDEQSGTSIKDIFDFNAGRLLTVITSEGIPFPPVEKLFSGVNPDFLKQAEEKCKQPLSLPQYPELNP